MKKIAIITLNDNNNYGNRLQNYAMQHQLEKLGFAVETVINNTFDKNKRKYIFKRLTIKKVLEKIKHYIDKKINAKYNTKLLKNRKSKFISFNNEYIKFSKYTLENDMNANDINNEYDYYIIGSDQVWNPYSPNKTETFFCNFAPKEKKIAYAASFGVSKIPDYMRNIYINGLKDMKYISIRENAGNILIKELINVDVPILVDPTMLLTKQDWINISKKIHNFDNQKKYILICFLGKYSYKRRKYIEKIARERNFNIVELNQIKEPKYYDIGPSEFIYCVENAEIILTDSFHVCVFSILFKKDFFALERKQSTESMNSRIETLLSKYNLSDRYIEDKNLERKINDKCDYSTLDDKMKYERDMAIKFLKKSLNIEEDNINEN